MEVPSVSLGKNFRLPTDCKPVRYSAHLAPDLAKGTFEGRMELEVRLQAPRREIHLHGIGLDVKRARARVQDRALKAAIAADAESETITLRFDEELPPGNAMLDLAWSGNFSPGLRGLYRAGPLAVTQFEAADARRVFPCFDEPAFKARWNLQLVGLPDGLTALSNGAVIKDQKEPGGGRTVQFAETAPLSSYLVAICVGELASSPERKARAYPVRTWAVPQKQALTAFGQEVACAVLPLLEDYFGQPYAYGKVDQVGVPDFEAGAMENAACITYREVALLLDPKTAPLNVQKRVAEVITHELSHQWFGNLVTMVWWDDLWLNEAFATWMAYKIVDQWRPQWRVWMDFEAGKGAALHLDALKSSHPIRAEIHNAEEAGESFDAITYEKGGAILRMIEGYLGEEKFREGIRLYMRRHREANATADDLWGALAEASGQPILELANGWIRQTGYPLVTLGLQEGKIRIAQRRFFSDPQATPEPTQWLVPLVLRIDGRERRVLLQSQEETLDPGGKPGWVLGNAGARGFYRTAYDPELLRRLVAALRELRPEERMALVSDQWALVRANAVKLEGFLHLLAGLRSEEDHTVLDEVVGRLGYLEHRGVSDGDRPAFHAWVRGLFAGPGGELGWDPAPAEDDERRLRRAAVLRALALVARDRAEIARANERFQEHLQHPFAIDPNLLDIVVAAAARDADEKGFEELRERARSELDPAAKRRYLHALAMVEEPRLVDRAVALALDPLVQMQDFSSYLGTLLGNRAAREAAWRLVQTRWDEVRTKADSPMILRRLVEALGSLPERRHLEEVEKFLVAHELPSAKQAVAQTLERLRADVALRDRLLPEMAAFLRGSQKLNVTTSVSE
ncbi:MAG: peptidase M1 [Deltaproteobacteria bacterium 13_1_40CM_4_68_19]|nr:MAG: peptidase M1 [Deltaproteobacteria bacterium 13_1_40CM_4_68_19]